MSGYEGEGTSMSDTSPSDYGGWSMASEVAHPAAQRGIPGITSYTGTIETEAGPRGYAMGPENFGPAQFSQPGNISVGPGGTFMDRIDAFFGKPENVARSVGVLAPGFNTAMMASNALARGLGSGIESALGAFGLRGTAPSELAPMDDPAVDEYGIKGGNTEELMAQVPQGIYQSPISQYAGLSSYANRPGVSAVVQALQSNPFLGVIPNVAATYLARGGYVPGKSGGMDDDVPAIIDGKQPARLSSGEFVFDAATVAALGDGNNQAGARKLEEIRKAIRKKAYGHERQPPKNYDIATLMART